MTKTKKFNRSGAYFSLPLFWQGIKKLRIPGIAMAITVIGLNIIQPLTSAASDRARQANYLSHLEGKMTEWGGMMEIPTMRVVDSFNEFAPVALALIAFAPLMAFLMFSYLNDRGKSDFYHSVPQTRLCVYISFIASIAAWLSAVLIATTALNLILWSTAVYHTLLVGEVLAVMACILLGSLLTMAIASLAMTLTGTTVSNLFVAILIFLAAPIVYWEYFEAMYDIVPAYLIEESWTRLLVMDNYYPFALFSAILSGSSRYARIIFDGGVVAYTVLLTIGLLLAGGAVYHTRRSESANQSAPNKLLQHVYRCVITLPLLLWPLLDALNNGLDTDHLWIIFLALILYILYELATTKKIKTMLRSLPIFGILIVACVAIYGSLYLVYFGVQADIPSHAEVKTVAVAPRQLRLDEDEFEAQDLAIEDDRAIALVMEALEFSAPLTRDEYRAIVNGIEKEMWDQQDNEMLSFTPPISYTSIDVHIKLNSGRTLHRSVWMDEQKWTELKSIYFESEAYRAAYLSIPSPTEVYSINLNMPMDYGLDTEQTAQLYAVFHAEYSALNPTQQKAIRDAEQYGGNDYLPRIVVSSTRYDRSLFVYIAPEYLPKTYAMVCEYDLQFNSDRKYHHTATTLSETLAVLSQLEITDLVGEKYTELKYEFYLDLRLCPAQNYATDDNRYDSSVHFYEVNFDLYNSKTTSNGKNRDFDRLMAAVAVLRKASNLQDYDNPTKKAFHLTLSWSNFPPEVNKELTYFDLHQYITLTPSEAAELLVALGYKPLDEATETVPYIE